MEEIIFTPGTTGVMTDRNGANTSNSYDSSIGFYAGTGVKKVTFQEGITHIGSLAFYGSGKNLQQIELPSTLESIGESAFSSCTNIRQVCYYQNDEAWNQIQIGSYNTPILNALRFDGINRVTGTSYTLDGTIAQNFYFKLPLDSIIHIGNTEISCMDADIIDGTIKITNEVPAAFLNKERTITITDAEGNALSFLNGESEEITSFTWSFGDYKEELSKNGESTSELNTLLDSMEQYGNRAALYFGTDYVTDNLSDVSSIVPDVTYETVISGELPEGLDYYGSSLVLNDTISIRHYFEGDFTDVTITVDGNMMELGQKGELTYIEIPGITAASLDQTFVCSIDDWTLNYSIFSYCRKALENGRRDALADLCGALIQYNQAVLEYAAA